MWHNDPDIYKILIPIIYQHKQWLPSTTFFLLSPFIFVVTLSIITFISELVCNRPSMESLKKLLQWSLERYYWAWEGAGGTHIVRYKQPRPQGREKALGTRLRYKRRLLYVIVGVYHLNRDIQTMNTWNFCFAHFWWLQKKVLCFKKKAKRFYTACENTNHFVYEE